MRTSPRQWPFAEAAAAAAEGPTRLRFSPARAQPALRPRPRPRPHLRRPRPCCARARLSGVGRHLADFARSTSVHGLKYLAEPQRPCHERLLWLVGMCAALAVCAALVWQTWWRWQVAPIIVAMDETTRPIWDIPFPAVTLCPVNKINASRFNFSDVHARALHGNASRRERLILAEMIILCAHQNENLTSDKGRDIVGLIEKFAPDIKETIPETRFMRNDLTGAFQPVLTEEGLCYSFNMLDGSEFFSPGTIHRSRNYLNYGKNSSEWNVLDGYSDTSDADSYPYRTVAIGENSGLIFKVEVSLCDMDAGCRDALEGHTITLHSPLEFPQPSMSAALRLPLAGGAKVSVRPSLVQSDASLRHAYPVGRRQCYFPDEMQLAFYRGYTQDKCELECLANFTLKLCGCVTFYMPRFTHTAVCGSSYKERKCVKLAKDKFQDVDFRARVDRLDGRGADVDAEPRGERERCRCLPSCVYYFYHGSASLFESQSAQWLNTIHKEKCNDASYEDKTTLQTKVSIYFDNAYFIPLRRMERFGVLDFLANCGGLLGLCLGVSALSVVEFFYWLLVRPWCINRRRKATTYSMRKKSITTAPGTEKP